MQAAAPTALTDFLDQKRTGAPAGDPPRGPNTVRALRIGKFRDGTKPGVLIQANDHAREWVPITITLETAERLVRNYATDPETKKIVDNTDLFLIPSNNPDGATYSFYNFASQRRNMTNHCPDENADPARRNAWGVDLNRNYSYASGFDGYDGASTSCISDTFQGPAELSEPESQNIIDLVQKNRNIKFMMSVHSNGGQLFWQPGAYIANGRITTPRPPLGTRRSTGSRPAASSRRSRRSGRRSSPPRTSAARPTCCIPRAGNVREELYFNYGVYAFGWEVGGSVYNKATGQFEEGSFQPPWVGDPDIVSGHSETMEYANGVMEMFRIAADWGMDKTAATSTLLNAEPVGLAEGRALRHLRAGDDLLHDRRLDADAAVPALQGDRVPRAGRDPVGGADDHVQVVLGRRRGQPRAGPLADGADRRDERARRHRAGDAVADARARPRRSARSRRASPRTTRPRRPRTSSRPRVTRR